MGSEGVSCVCLCLCVCVCSASIRVWMSSDRVPSPQAQASVNGCWCSMVCFFPGIWQGKSASEACMETGRQQVKAFVFFCFLGVGSHVVTQG